jgi:hypothetical protein
LCGSIPTELGPVEVVPRVREKGMKGGTPVAFSIHAVLLACSALGLVVAAVGAGLYVYISIKGTHLHQTTTTSMKVVGVGEVTTGGSLGLMSFGILLIAAGPLLWNWIPSDVVVSPSETAAARPPGPTPPTAPSSLAPPSSEQTPINWQPDFQMNWYSGPQMAWIRFIGKSTTLASIKDAYIVSKLTGHRESLQIANATNFNERWNVNLIEPIPPGATTMLVYEPKPPPSIPDFLNQWGAFEFHVVYEDGEYTKIYSQDYVHDKFASELPGIYGPHVTPMDKK